MKHGPCVLLSESFRLIFDVTDMMLRKLDSIQKWLFCHMLSTAGHFMAWSGHGQDIQGMRSLKLRMLMNDSLLCSISEILTRISEALILDH